jgi:hypothetical protein
MTISSTTVKNSYSGNGSTTAFAYTFKIFANTDLQVIIRSSTGTETVKTLTTHYTVSGVGDASGGNVTFTSGNTPASGETVVIRRAVPQTQAIDYIANDPFPAESHEEGLDRATMTVQQMQEELDRSFKVSRTNTISSPEFTDDATTRASKTLGFDSSGNLTTVADFLPAGGDSAMFQYSTTTTDADPGAGEIAFNNGTYASATEIYIDDADAHGASTATDVQSWGSSTSTIKGFLHIVDINDSSTYARFKITAAVTDASGYNKITVAHLASNNTFSAADELSVHFTRTGLKGDTGSTGATGSTGSTGATGAAGTNSQLSMTFESTTSDADPGAGKIAFNNGTLSSVSILYVDDADDAGADITSFVQSWDDVSNTEARGIVTVTKEGTPSTYATFKVSGAVTDASGYTKVPVTHVVSAGSFSDDDGVGVHFSYSGADGAGTSLSGSTNNTITTVTGANAIIGEANLTFDGTDLLIASTGKLYLNDAGGEHISGNGSILSIAGGNEIDLTATAIDINGTCDVSGVSTFGAAANVTQQALTSSSNAVAWDASAKPNAYHITTENTTFSAPTNNVEGAFICLEINYNGSHTIAFNTVFEFAGSTAPTFTSTDGKTDILVFRNNGAVWQEVGRTLNLSES